MRLYFANAELLLRKDETGNYVLEQFGQRLATFTSEKKAEAEFKKIRRELEAKFPPTAVTDEERKTILAKYVADTLVQHNSLRDGPAKKPAKSRTFG